MASSLVRIDEVLLGRFGDCREAAIGGEECKSSGSLSELWSRFKLPAMLPCNIFDLCKSLGGCVGFLCEFYRTTCGGPRLVLRVR